MMMITIFNLRVFQVFLPITLLASTTTYGHFGLLDIAPIISCDSTKTCYCSEVGQHIATVAVDCKQCRRFIFKQYE